MRSKILFLIMLISVSGKAFSTTVCDSQVTREIEACSKENFEELDKDLNQEYRRLMRKFQEVDKGNLLSGQRHWISYRDKYCQAAFDSISPGEEAGVDKWSCLESVTAARTKELRYINSLYSMKDFYRALTLMADIYEGGNQKQVMDKLINRTPDGKNPDWIRYVEENCKITYSKLREDHDACVARMNFYKNW